MLVRSSRGHIELEHLSIQLVYIIGGYFCMT